MKTIFTKTYIRSSPYQRIFWPSGSIAASISLIFTLPGTISGNFWIFHSFFPCYDQNAFDLPFQMSGLHCGSPSWLAPWNFMVEIHLSEPFSTSAMKFTLHNWWTICIQTVISKNNGKISKSREIVPNEEPNVTKVEIEKRALLLNQAVNTIMQKGRFLM